MVSIKRAWLQVGLLDDRDDIQKRGPEPRSSASWDLEANRLAWATRAPSYIGFAEDAGMSQAQSRKSGSLLNAGAFAR
jgi:hypothetical protein